MTTPESKQQGKHLSLAEKLAAFFRSHPNVDHDGRVLSGIAGFYAFRTRISDLRRHPYNMVIENTQMRVKRQDGTTFTVSYYKFVQESPPRMSVVGRSDDGARNTVAGEVAEQDPRR